MRWSILLEPYNPKKYLVKIRWQSRAKLTLVDCSQCISFHLGMEQRRSGIGRRFDRILSTEMTASHRPPVQPVSSPLTSNELIIICSVQRIESAWLSYRNRRIFRLLKHAVRAAENSLPLEILRRICSKEAELLKDPCMKVNIRFRFGGESFPPLIFFKIFLCNSYGQGVKYMSGKRIIRPSTAAARSACQLMGHRKFYEQLVVDSLQHQTHKMTDEVDVTTLKDYMKYASTVDEMPASLGGRENSWRQLTLEVLPRHTIFYDVIEFLQSRRISSNLEKELPALLTVPVTQEMQQKHIQILTTIRTPLPTDRVYTPKLRPEPTVSSGRRSKQARLRSLQMRMAYLGNEQQVNDNQTMTGLSKVNTTSRPPELPPGELDFLEDEAERLYEWTQGLSLEALSTPRLSTSLMS